VIGGLKAVIYTDTVQWLILLVGLILVTIPVALWGELGGIAELRRELPPEFFSLTNVDAVTLVNWLVTIIPIWLVGMTLYQRMYACRSVADARRAWYIAGLLEYPVMAFMGVFLGMCGRVMFPEVESEMGLPLLIKTALPVGVTGIVIASYFSAIMSTADSCLMASSGNLVNDVLRRYWLKDLSAALEIRLSQLATLLIGISAAVLASQFEKVLGVILMAYAFMVSGLFMPTLGAFFWPRGTSQAAFWSMLSGGGLTLALLLKLISLPAGLAAVGLDPVCYGMALSAVTYVSLSLLFPAGGDRDAAMR
jgi:SSS family solute:Na+ symporter